jgi:hypothetical protein
MIGPDVTMTLWGCVFEDFLGQGWDDGRWPELRRRLSQSSGMEGRPA